MPAFDPSHERVIDEGYLAMRCTDPQGQTLILEVFGPDGILPRQAEGVLTPAVEFVALQDTMVIVVPLKAWDAHAAADPVFAFRVNAARARQHLALLTRLSSFLSSSSTRRVAGAIAYLCERTGQSPPEPCIVRLSQGRLGALAGLSRAAANRAVHQLREAGVLTVGRMSLTVPDVDRLFEYASGRVLLNGEPEDEPDAAA